MNDFIVIVGTIASVVAAIFAVWAVILQLRASRRDRPDLAISLKVPYGQQGGTFLRMGVRNNGRQPALIVEMGAEVRSRARVYPALTATYGLPAKVDPQVQFEHDLGLVQLATLVGDVPERIFVVDGGGQRHFAVIEVADREQMAAALRLPGQ